MEQNYYDILEVSKNASPEIIEKAYKTLVKKYHPDLQIAEEKNKYEEKIKKINEAYDILSNSEKRKNYDLNLKNTEISIDNYNALYQENINLKNNLKILKEKLNNLNNIQNNNYENNNCEKNNYENNNCENNNCEKNNYENNNCENNNYENNNYQKNNLNYNNIKKNKNNYSENIINNNFNSNNNDKIYYIKMNIKNIYNNLKLNFLYYLNKLIKDLIALIITILILIFIFSILKHIPFTKNYLTNHLFNIH